MTMIVATDTESPNLFLIILGWLEAIGTRGLVVVSALQILVGIAMTVCYLVTGMMASCRWMLNKLKMK